jgi:hypothetical protein
VAGGTFPALIWKTFAERALRYMNEPPRAFPTPHCKAATPVRVAYRKNRWLVDNGHCTNTRVILYVSGYEPREQADCKPNEVDVPHVIGATLAAAQARLGEMPLSAEVLARPARPGERLGVVVDQFPRSGTLSSWETVRIVTPKPTEGVVPRVVGLTLQQAQARLTSRGLVPVVEAFAQGGSQLVVAQSPHANVAASREMVVKLRVGRG